MKVNRDILGCGGIFKDEARHWLCGFYKYIVRTNTYMAKLWGILQGLKIAKDRGFTHIVLQSDSQYAISAIKGDKFGVAERGGS